MGRNQARRRGEVDHGRAGAIPEGQVRQPRVAGIESSPLRSSGRRPSVAASHPHSLILMGGWKFGENWGQMCGSRL